MYLYDKAITGGRKPKLTPYDGRKVTAIQRLLEIAGRDGTEALGRHLGVTRTEDSGIVYAAAFGALMQMAGDLAHLVGELTDGIAATDAEAAEACEPAPGTVPPKYPAGAKVFYIGLLGHCKAPRHHGTAVGVAVASDGAQLITVDFECGVSREIPATELHWAE